MIKDSKEIDLPFSKCAKHVCVLKVITHLNNSLNFTVLRMKVGLNDRLKCVCHGLSIIGEKIVFTFCLNLPKRNIHRNNYSEKSQLWIILFCVQRIQYNKCNSIIVHNKMQICYI